MLTQDSSSVSASYTLGEQAHIVGERDDAPRGKSPLTEDERNAYHNLILLCPTHHSEIDKNEGDWPVEKLHKLKTEHELWVTETLSESADMARVAQSVVVASLVDGAVQKCNLANWKNWTSYALSPHPEWPNDLPDSIFEFRQQVIAAIWPDKFEELKRAATTLSILLNRAAHKFLEHAELRGDRYVAIRFYKLIDPNPRYDEDVEKFETWLEDSYELVYQATKAANWFADVVRRDVNPMFFAESGKFLIEEGPYDGLSWRTRLLEYTKEEKENLPSGLAAAALH
jgi:hypothetical protein